MDKSLLEKVKPLPGIYELADDEMMTVYIGSSDNLRARLEQHLMEPATSCIKHHAALCRFEYTKDYKIQEHNLRDLFLKAFGSDPKCN